MTLRRLWSLSRFAVPDFALNIFWQGIFFYNLFFLTEKVGYSLPTASVIVTIGVAVSAVSDVAVGALVPRSGHGYARLIRWSALPLGLSFIANFAPFPVGQAGSGVAFFVAQIVFFICYALASISYVSWLTENVVASEDRTIVSAARMLLGGVAALLVAWAMPVVSAMTSGGGASSYTLASALFAAVACAVLLGSVRGTGDRPAHAVSAQSFASSSLGEIFGSRAFLLFNLAGVGIGIFGTSIARSAPSYFTAALGDAGIGSALAIMTAAGVASVLGWAALGIRTGRLSIWSAAAALGLVVAAAFSIAAPLPATVAIGAFALLQIAASGANVSLWALLPDLADQVHRATRQPLSAICGATAFCQKMAVAIGTLLLGASGGIGQSGGKAAILSAGFLYPAMVGMVVTLAALALYSRATRR